MELVIAIVGAVIKYGPSAVQTISTAMKDKDITPEDIKDLFIDKDPAEYFK